MSTPQYLNKSTIDDVARMITALTEEVWILRDRTMVLEHLLSAQQVLPADAVDTHEPTGELELALARERDRLIRRVLAEPLKSDD